jgi:L-ascorbate metabolism protein UlaG (beta-lactamase superfamily)
MLSHLFAAGLLLLFLMTSEAGAAAGGCLAMAEGEPGVTPAAFSATALEADQVQITYIGHSSFIIESPKGIRIVTDYTGNADGIVPDAVTMNRAHSSHFTDFPDPAIKHVLRGWNHDGSPAQHDVVIGDVRIRNVTTDIRGGEAGRQPNGNSIFIFEIADLCIGHLGHLHHDLGLEHLGLIGHLDIVLVPVDGGYTMAQSAMLEVLKTLKARIVIPMHYFGPATLARFIGTMGGSFELEFSSSPERIISSADLPERPKLLVLPGH